MLTFIHKTHNRSCPPPPLLPPPEDVGGSVVLDKLISVALPAVHRPRSMPVKEFLEAHTARMARKIELRVPMFSDVSRDQLLRVLRQVVMSQITADDHR